VEQTLDPRTRERLQAQLSCLEKVTLPRLVQTLAATGGGTPAGRAARAALEAEVRAVRSRADTIRRHLRCAPARPGLPAQRDRRGRTAVVPG
jgi:hypothetical protein